MILLVGAEKGGAGKTTIATNLAVLRAMDGRDVLLVDADKQGTATYWAETRSDRGHHPAITCVAKRGNAAGFDIVKLRDKFDDIIVDCGGRDSLELRAISIIADVILTPMRPSSFDVWSLEFMEQLVNDARLRGNADLRAILCVNAANPNPFLREAQECADLIRETDSFIPANTIIYDRVAFRRAARSGQGVLELTEGDTHKACEDIRGLYAEVYRNGGTTITPVVQAGDGQTS